MDLIKKNKIIIAVLLPVLILVLIRTVNPNHFKNDAVRWAEPSVIKSNTVTFEEIRNLTGEILLINLDEDKPEDPGIITRTFDITPETILDKKNIRVIRDHKGPVLLYSSQISISARIWMLLSQLGFKDIFILSGDKNNEALKNEFRPDTLVRPEF